MEAIYTLFVAYFILLFYLGGALLAGYVGGVKRSATFSWLALGLLLSPPLALLALAALPARARFNPPADPTR